MINEIQLTLFELVEINTDNESDNKSSFQQENPQEEIPNNVIILKDYRIKNKYLEILNRAKSTIAW